MNLLKAVSIAIVVATLAGCRKPENEAMTRNAEARSWTEADAGMSAAQQAADENLTDSNSMAEAAEVEVRQ